MPEERAERREQDERELELRRDEIADLDVTDEGGEQVKGGGPLEDAAALLRRRTY